MYLSTVLCRLSFAGVNGVLGSADTHWLLARLEELELQAWNGAGPLGAPGSPEEGLVEVQGPFFWEKRQRLTAGCAALVLLSLCVVGWKAVA